MSIQPVERKEEFIEIIIIDSLETHRKNCIFDDTSVYVSHCKSYPLHFYYLFSFSLLLLSLFCNPDLGGACDNFFLGAPRGYATDAHSSEDNKGGVQHAW